MDIYSARWDPEDQRGRGVALERCAYFHFWVTAEATGLGMAEEVAAESVESVKK